MTAGIVAAAHQGSSNFAIAALDQANESTGDPLVNTIGDYSGTTALGLSALGDATSLQVTAGDAWTLEVAQVSSAPELEPPAAGRGDAVWIYRGDAATWARTHAGEGNFAVIRYARLFPGLLVNENGAAGQWQRAGAAVR